MQARCSSRARPARAATGLKYDRNRLFVAGAAIGKTRAVIFKVVLCRNGTTWAARCCRTATGILLDGKTVCVMRNQNNRIAVGSLDSDLTSGSLERVITSGGFDVPTTIARFAIASTSSTRASRLR